MVTPLESITSKKLDNIRTTAHIFMQSHPDLAQFGRIDAVSITLKDDENSDINHFTNVGQI